MHQTTQHNISEVSNSLVTTMRTSNLAGIMLCVILNVSIKFLTSICLFYSCWMKSSHMCCSCSTELPFLCTVQSQLFWTSKIFDSFLEVPVASSYKWCTTFLNFYFSPHIKTWQLDPYTIKPQFIVGIFKTLEFWLCK